LIVIHHLVVDGVSWRILLEDLQRGYEQVSRGERMELGSKSTSYRRWTEVMKGVAESEEMEEQSKYWIEEGKKEVKRLPRDKEGGRNRRASGRGVTRSLSREETKKLLRDVAQANRTQINEVLALGLVEAIGEWVGERRIRVDMEGHGREEVEGGVEVTRTVGWMTSVYPIVLEVRGGEEEERLKEVKEQVRRVPWKGVGYGLLRYKRGGEIGEEIRRGEEAEVSFNYLGQLDQAVEENGWLEGAEESKGESQSEEGEREYLLDVNGRVSGGRLRISWGYSSEVHNRETIERLADSYIEALRKVIRRCETTDVAAYTPSDFPLTKLNQQKLDYLISRFSESEEGSYEAQNSINN
jgi:non-ribosomal peptide synthase protein (TIGR01720 family)